MCVSQRVVFLISQTKDGASLLGIAHTRTRLSIAKLNNKKRANKYTKYNLYS